MVLYPAADAWRRHRCSVSIVVLLAILALAILAPVFALATTAGARSSYMVRSDQSVWSSAPHPGQAEAVAGTVSPQTGQTNPSAGTGNFAAASGP